MVYVEVQNRNGKFYYYLTHSIRDEDNKVQKVRHFVESSDKEYNDEEKELLKLAYNDTFESILDGKRPLRKKTDFSSDIFFEDEWEVYTKEDLEEIDGIRENYQEFLKNKNLDYVEKRQEQFMIRHSYDTNKVEGNSFTFDETYSLLKKGLITNPKEEREVYEIKNIKIAFDFISTYKGEFNNYFIKKIHTLVTKNTLKYPESEGKYREKGYNVGMGGSEYRCVPGGYVKKQCDIIFRDFSEFYKKDKLGAIIRFYSAFIAIHPFIDGNGRTSRMVLNYLLLQEGLPPINFIDNHHGIHITYLEESRNGGGHTSLAQFILNQLRNNLFLK
jgi:Fic family protein